MALISPQAKSLTDETGSAIWPMGRGYAWFVVLILAAAYAISLIDRNFLGLVIEQIKVDRRLSDLQIGFLLGPAFAILYVALGVPFGWLADRGNRRTIIASGMALWCLAASACGIAPNFALLFLARLGVGIGEATLSPCALSLIADFVPTASRARAIGVYVLGANFGGGMAYLVGSQVMLFLSIHSPRSVPALSDLKPWQLAFIALGMPGIVVAALMLFIKEPRTSRPKPEAGAASRPSPLIALRLMGQQWRAYLVVFGSMASMFVVGYMGLWTSAVFQRSWGWSIERIGFVNGGIIIASSPPGALFAGWLSDTMTKRGRSDGAFLALLCGALLICPAYGLYPLAPNGTLGAIALFIGLFGQHIISTAGPVAVFQITKREIRGQAISWYYLILSISGLVLGPPAIGFLTGMLGGASMLRYSVSIVGAVFGAIAIIVLLLGRRSFTRAAIENDGAARNESPP